MLCTTGVTSKRKTNTNYIITEEKETECCTDGYAVYVCSCGDQYTKTSKARGYHDWSEWEIVREATTTKEGLMQRSCPDCEKIEEKTIAKLVEETKPTATQPVATEPSVTTPPATEAPATETPSHVHSYKETVVAPTCSEKGYTIHKCSCGDSYKDTYVDASGHSWSNWTTTKEATTSAEGEQTRTCGRCQETETQAIAKLPATETISTSELQAYGMSYGASLGFTLDYNLGLDGGVCGYFPPDTVPFNSMDAARQIVAANVDSLYTSLMNANGSIEGCRINVTVVKNGDGTYTTTVYYG